MTSERGQRRLSQPGGSSERWAPAWVPSHSTPPASPRRGRRAAGIRAVRTDRFGRIFRLPPFAGQGARVELEG